MPNPQITVIGRLGKTPETSYTPTGKAIARLSLATTNSRKNTTTGEWEETETSWWNVTTWDKQAEALIEANLQPGTQLIAVGELTENTYTKKDGTTAHTTQLTARTIATVITTPKTTNTPTW